MERLIPIINKLQDVFAAIGSKDQLDLPQIVVIGSQSSGKSSVLEHIVGKDFLPRGSGIVTRRPLILQLNHISNTSHDGKEPAEWGEFTHRPGERFSDFDKIREEIERETDRITGKNRGISAAPITLKIFSPHVLNLSLVDLPGITRVPVGDQPPDIERHIRTMLHTYIDRPNAIILAITAANQDLSNSDALQMAKEVDPNGERTLGVLTKLDIMDRGTDALDALMGRVIPLKLGYIGVVLRGQADINSRKPIREALKSEAEYFATQPQYRTIASRMGTPYLAKTLNKILIQHIRNTLPDLKNKVNKMHADTQMELLSYGDPLYDSKSSRGALLLQIITRFSADYRDAIDGKLSDLSAKELYGGARINFIFNEIYARCLDSINPTEGLTHNDIRTAIHNATGPKAALFVPEIAFELLVKGQITRLEDPSTHCVELVHDELQRIVDRLETKELIQFSNLRDRVLEIVNHLLSKRRSPSREMINNLINIELAFINTNHPDFIGGDGAITAIVERMAKNQQVEREMQAQQSIQPPVPQRPIQSVTQQAPVKGTTQTTAKATTPTATPTQSQTPQQEAQSGFFNIFFGGKHDPSSSITPVRTGGSSSAEPAQPSQLSRQTMAASTSMNRTGHASTNTYQGDYRSLSLNQVPGQIKLTNTPTDKENFETELIKYLLVSYFEIVKKNIKDTVPKTIMHFMVNQSKELIQNELVSELYKEELFDELFSVSSEVVLRREACKNLMDTLKKAHEILNEVRDFQIS